MQILKQQNSNMIPSKAVRGKGLHNSQCGQHKDCGTELSQPISTTGETGQMTEDSVLLLAWERFQDTLLGR